ncbi:hypothetical protein DESUT3_23110 [Desulfuromonas versatilis]|uniref:DUF4388 domain-containing protein n=1 Tax=Desulfuromonas versatilis TaxID=2802975 RepID=A0ABM8HXJ7_9BACT|nr:hypothetical protein [Desulfuromonas versatilis]BCR05242.1 hypothetical protein DESUT3_23110 [Desulfuromonas versatilis]
MVWLNMMAENGSGLYLDIHGIEPRGVAGGTVIAVSGTVGDGRYEGEVLVEVGARTGVTFADEWLDGASLREFFGNAARGELETALTEAVAGLSLAEKVRLLTEGAEEAGERSQQRPHRDVPRPHPYRRPRALAQEVREQQGEWQS